MTKFVNNSLLLNVQTVTSLDSGMYFEFSPDGNTILCSMDYNGSMYQYDVSNGHCVRRLNYHCRRYCGKKILSNRGEHIIVWDVATGSVIHVMDNQLNYRTSYSRISPCGHVVKCTHNNGNYKGGYEGIVSMTLWKLH